ncbi:MAG TPA: 3-deoxy-D-manno-octulosonic acid transferase [Candidatus Acidoferrum sp.]|nr:3-deoxy-D-manno-octulosonic acid transferase [Candidatus Acidoferrum sp.]
MVRFIYNLVFLLGFSLSAPFYFLKMWRRGNWRAGFGERFASYDSKFKQSITNRDIIWLHAVSVGEVNICTQLIKTLEPRVPKLKIVVSTTTSTGMAELKKKLPSHIAKIYYPLDRRKYVRRALRLMNPQAVVLMEAEIWPNFLWRCRDLGTPVFLVNARLSDRSFRGYKRYGMLFRSVFKSFAGVGCQNESDAKRLAEIGCRPERIHVVGNLKFDAATLTERSLDVPAMLAQLGVSADAPVIVAGSTHDGEEKILGEIFARLRARVPDLFLIVVPRHFERGKEAGRDLESSGLKVMYRSEFTSALRRERGEVNVLLVNTTGELRYFYEIATVVFVGKSLTAVGGQNPIEPGALAKPIVFGPNMQNFEAITSMLVSRKGARQVRDAAELEETFEELLTNKAQADQLGRNAQIVVRENLGSMERTVEMIVSQLPARG